MHFHEIRSIYLHGRFDTRKTRLHFMLRAAGIRRVLKYTPSVDAVVVGTATLPPPPAPVQYTEQTLLANLTIHTDNPFYTQPEDSIAAIRALLQTERTEDIDLAALLLHAQGLPDALLTDCLFVYYVTGHLGLRRVLRMYGPSSLFNFMGDLSQCTVSTLLARIPMLDASRFAQYFWKRPRPNLSDPIHVVLRYCTDTTTRQQAFQALCQDGHLTWRNYLVDDCRPEEWEKITQAHHVTLQRYNAHQLPEAFYSLQQLKYLTIEQTLLKEGHWALHRFPALEVLQLNNAHVEGALSFFEALPPLEVLHIDCSTIFLDTYHVDIVFWNRLLQFSALQNLKALILRDCGLSHFPKVLHLRLLKYIDFTDNFIAELPQDIDLLEALTYFNLYGNCLEALPSSMAELTQLRELVLSDNTEVLNVFLDTTIHKWYGTRCEVKYDNVR